jgi:hypothetical protein
VPDQKFIPKIDLRSEPLDGTIDIQTSFDSGLYTAVGTMSVADSVDVTFNGPETKMFEADFRITLTRSASDSSLGPVVTRWMARAYAAPLRSEIFSVPLLMHHRITGKNGQDYWFDVDDELSRLRALVSNPKVVSYQENADTYSVIVEDVRWIPIEPARNHNEWDWNGTCVVILRSVR